ncbi:MAG: potassium-transporting ATPase subunit F [Lacunisphaera sp.]
MPFSARSSAELAALINSNSPAMENILIGFIALALLAYLVTAVIRPEKF